MYLYDGSVKTTPTTCRLELEELLRRNTVTSSGATSQFTHALTRDVGHDGRDETHAHVLTRAYARTQTHHHRPSHVSVHRLSRREQRASGGAGGARSFSLVAAWRAGLGLAKPHAARRQARARNKPQSFASFDTREGAQLLHEQLPRDRDTIGAACRVCLRCAPDQGAQGTTRVQPLLVGRRVLERRR